jgi:hypothetical protein
MLFTAGTHKCIQALVARGSSLVVPDGFGRTVVDRARIHGATDIAGTPTRRYLATRIGLRCGQAGASEGCLTAQALRASPLQITVDLYELGYALLYLGDTAETRYAFA